MEGKKRNLYLALIAVLTLIVVIFVVQNFGHVTVAFLSSSMSLPLSVLALLIYLLGMLTGGLVLSLVRSLARGVKKPTVK